MKKSLSWISLSKQKSTFWKFNNDPKITDAFLSKMETESLEGKIPPEGKIDAVPYKGGWYRIDREWQFYSPDGKIMKPFFHPEKRGPRVRIRKSVKKNWEIQHVNWEVWLILLMDKVFWPYFPNYSLKKKYPNAYILEPIDWDYKNIRYSNLHYVNKNQFRNGEKTKRAIIKDFVKISPNNNYETISKMTNASKSYIRKVREEALQEKGEKEYIKRKEIMKETNITISPELLPIYEALLNCQWQLSNLEIAKIIWKDVFEWEISPEKQRELTDKVVRIRKRLSDKWLIPRYNSIFEKKREEAVILLKNKEENGLTNKEIAEKLWLSLDQINNLSRQIKKEKIKNDK